MGSNALRLRFMFHFYASRLFCYYLIRILICVFLSVCLFLKANANVLEKCMNQVVCNITITKNTKQ